MSQDPVSLDEAASKGAMSCSRCGGPGAHVRIVDGHQRLICAGCEKRGRAWNWILSVLVLAALLLGGKLLFRGGGALPANLPENAAQPEAWVKETTDLMKMRKFREARDRIQQLLEALPKHPLLNMMLGQCLMRLKDDEGAVAAFQAVMDHDPETRDIARIYRGVSLQNLGRVAEALPLLEAPQSMAELEDLRRFSLTECYLDLERFEDALKLLDADPDAAKGGRLWAKHRALLYSGKPEEALKLLDGRDELEVASLRAMQLRELGDFEAARAVLSAQAGKVQASTAPWYRLKRAQLSLALEAGRPEDLDQAAGDLAADAEPQARGEGLYGKVLVHLMAGRGEAARAAAWEFLAKCPKDYSPLRLERLALRHVVGELKEADLEAEAKRLSRFHANDIYAYLALATKSRSWAEKAAAATPGRNYPYHLIQRLLKN